MSETSDKEQHRLTAGPGQQRRWVVGAAVADALAVWRWLHCRNGRHRETLTLSKEWGEDYNEVVTDKMVWLCVDCANKRPYAAGIVTTPARRCASKRSGAA